MSDQQPLTMAQVEHIVSKFGGTDGMYETLGRALLASQTALRWLLPHARAALRTRLSYDTKAVSEAEWKEFEQAEAALLEQGETDVP